MEEPFDNFSMRRVLDEVTCSKTRFRNYSSKLESPTLEPVHPIKRPWKFDLESPYDRRRILLCLTTSAEAYAQSSNVKLQMTAELPGTRRLGFVP
jgi:hypothetical protein